jgi:vacuolar protein sorting-associated protein 13A/C
MLEGLVSSLLNRFLGMYIRNFDPAQLKVGIWSGDVKLRDLELRREALDQLKLPINVVEGHLGQLTLTIPWSNLRGQPVKVFIEDVFLLAAPKEDAEYDEEEEERRRQAVKIEKLDSAEILKERNAEGLSQEEQKKSQSFTESLVSTIVNNLQITIKNIHVRYEDSISALGHPFALGVTLEEFSAVSTDGDWTPTYIQASTGIAHKLATLGSLAVYWNTDSKLLGTGREAEIPGASQVSTHDEILEAFKEMIVKGESPDIGNHQFILKPVSGQAKIEMNNTGRLDKPKVKAALLFDEIGLVLDDDQYRDALMMVDLFHYFMRHQEYRKLQPKGVTPKEDPRAWLKFAGNAVLSKIHDRNRRWSWDFFKERRDDRVRYIELFKKRKKQEQPMTPEETEEIDKLEWKLMYEDLRFWRSLARNQLKKENIGVKKPALKQQQGWLAWAWGSKPQESQETEDTTMTDEQRQELYKAIDWDEKNALAESVDLPRETVKVQINADLKVGSFALKRDIHNQAVEVLSLYFDSFKAKVLQRPDSFLADVSLGGLRVNDGTTANSLYPQIVRVKDSSGPQDMQLINTSMSQDTSIDPFFQLQFEQNPLDGKADLAVTAKLKSMEIIYNPNFIVEIVRFFKPPERHMDSIYALMDTAGATVESLRQQTRAGLEFALEEHKTIDAKLSLQAPLIIIPEDIETERSTCLILDAGHISVNSELVDKETLRDIQSKQKQSYSDDDFKRLEGLMYDKFVLELTATQVLIGPSMWEVRAHLEDNQDKSLYIVDRINIRFIVEISIVPKAPNLPKMRVSGNLPVLHASMSDLKYKSLMRIINVAIPRFDDDEAVDGKAALPVDDTVAKELAKRPRAQSSVSQRRRSHRQSASFQFTAQEAVILEESDNDDDGEFQDASNGRTDADLKVQQRSFELSFTIARLQGSLYRSDPEGKRPDKLLVELVAEHFSIDFYLRSFDMVAEVSLQSLSLDDHVEENPLPEFKRLISSRDADSEEKALVQVKYVKVKRDSPEFMPVYSGIETNLDVAISTINLIVTRKTLLTLLDFILITFTNPNGSETSAMESSPAIDRDSDLEAVTPAQKSADPEKIRVQVSLKKISLVLNNDGIRLATLSLIAADLGIFLMGKTMRIGAKLGDLSLLDDIDQGAPLDMRQLVTIQGKELADFSYETFDPDSGKAYPGYDSSIGLRAGSLKVNFISEPFRKIIDFLVKFGKMQALFNAARQAAANQASQIQQNAGKMHFDINIRTPIIVFPRVMTTDTTKRDLITAYLGEIYAQNKFVPLDDSKNSPVAMKLSAGIRNIRLTSDFHFPDEKSEELEMIHQVDLGFSVTYAEHQQGIKRPDMEITGNMTDFNLRITQAQMKFLLELSRTVPAAFSSDEEAGEQEAAEELPDSVVNQAKAVTPEQSSDDGQTLIDLGPELRVDPENWAKLDLVFKVSTVGLEMIIAKEDDPVGDLEAASLSKFSLDDTTVKLRMISDGSLESEFTIQSFTIQDSRSRETNKFRKIMTSLNPKVQQFMASVTISGGKERNLIAMVAIDSPRFIFALDYVFAIQAFISGGLAVDELAVSDQLVDISEESAEESDMDSRRTDGKSEPLQLRKKTKAAAQQDKLASSPQPSMSIAFRVNVVDAQIILIANPLSTSSEAIVLGTKQILISQQHALTLQLAEMGMFLCRMDRFEDSRLRILDDFSLMLSMDSSQPFLSSIHIDVQPLVLRLSLRDILLALQIVSKASELSGGEEKEQKAASSEKAKQLKGHDSLKRRSASGKGISTMTKSKKPTTVAPSHLQRGVSYGSEKHPMRKTEELTATFEGMRVILIGNLHELPILDLSVKNFTVNAKDWSSNMKADTSIDMFTNVYNFSKSAWEPLIEPWQLGFQMSKQQEPNRLSVELSSSKTLELTFTSATIALASKAARFLTQEQDVLSKPRGADAPYRIRNYTGFDMHVWADIPGEEEPLAAKLEDGQEAPWLFEDAGKMRENLASDNCTSILGVRLEGSGFDSVNKIPVNREGEYLYNLRPRKEQVLHRLLVDIKLGTDNVKYVTFRSPLLVENSTQIPVEIGVFNVEQGHLLKIEKIAPGESRPAPVGAAFLHSLLVRPDQGFGYTWSTESLFWRDLLQRPTRTMTCRGENGDKTPPFYFQMNATYDKSNPLTRYVFRETKTLFYGYFTNNMQ